MAQLLYEDLSIWMKNKRKILGVTGIRSDYDIMSSVFRSIADHKDLGLEIAVMGAKGAVEILFRNELDDPQKIDKRTLDYEERFANPFIAAERGFLDDVIIPSNSRFRLIQAFSKLKHKTQSNPKKKFGNIPL